MDEKSGSLIEWLVPLAFVVCAGWVVWHMPAFILDFNWQTDESQRANLEGLYLRNDVTPNMGGLMGGFTDLFDWLALIGIIVFAVYGRVYGLGWHRVADHSSVLAYRIEIAHRRDRPDRTT